MHILRLQIFLLITSIFLIIFVFCGCTSTLQEPFNISKNLKFFENIADNKYIIFHLNFEGTPLGIYCQESLNDDWNNPPWSQGIMENRVEIVENNQSPYGKSLKIIYPKGFSGPWKSGAQWILKLNNNYENLYCAYSIKFDESFDFVLGGKLPGLVGGAANTGGKIPDGYDGWSARMMWRHLGGIVQYVYHPDQLSKWGDDFPWRKNFIVYHSFLPGRWYTVEHHIKMNTPKNHDGIIECWLNGKPALKESQLRFRDTYSLAVDSFYFSTFFGGQGLKWAPRKDEFIYFDNFVISTEPITH